MEMHNWWLFASIALVATLTPGPAVLLVTSHSVSCGWRNAVFTILGNISGLFIMSALSVLGLSAIILSSSLVFALVKFVGAAYLVFLGIRIWRNGFVNVSDHPQAVRRAGGGKKMYLQGLAIAISNPKAIAFTTALFPQFIDQESALPAQFTILVATIMFLSFICLLGFAYAAERARNGLFASVPSYLNKIFGVGFIASAFALVGASSR